MSPNRRSYEDGVDDGNSSWHDRDRFQNDNDYYEGVRDGWREKEQRAGQARDDATQKMLDRADRGYDNSSGSDAQGLSCGVTIALFLISTFLAGLFTPVLTPFAGPLGAPIIGFGASIFTLIYIAKSMQSK